MGYGSDSLDFSIGLQSDAFVHDSVGGEKEMVTEVFLKLENIELFEAELP